MHQGLNLISNHVIILIFFTGISLASQPESPEKQSLSKSDKVYYRDPRKSITPCPDRDNITGFLKCPRNCTLDSQCSKPAGEECICFGECGFSCINKKKAFCRHPGFLDNGKVVYVGPSGLYELQYLKEKVPLKGHILYECEEGYALIDGPPGKSCEDGKWVPSNTPKCTKTNGPGFHWLRTGRLKRRAIKTGGSSMVNRNKGGGGGGGGVGPRRPKKKGTKPGEDDDYDPVPLVCNDLDNDPYLQIEVIQQGDEQNETFSAGAVVKVSCTSGFGVNLPNETVRCEKGRWKPKIPQCSALPCKTPYMQHGTFYNGSKPLYFQEMKKHQTTIELRCTKGYKLKGPAKLHCWFGEWDVQEAPECVPAPCQLPPFEFGSYMGNYESGKTIVHGTEIDYTCGGDFRKLIPGPVRCELGDWKPSKPYCVHPSVSSGSNDPHDGYDGNKKGKGGKSGGRGDKVIQLNVKRSCGSPPKEKGAYTYVGGLPLDWDTQFSFVDATEVLYRCGTLKPKARNRWKLTCEDGNWVGTANLTCDGDAPIDKWMSLPIMSMINGSCGFKKTDKHVVTFYNDQVIIDEKSEFPHQTVLISRCVDIGKFRLEGAVRRKCLSGMWLGVTPRCEGLSQYHDYALDKSPTILFRYKNGSIVQSNDGGLIVYPGTTLHMECLWIRKFGKPRWDISTTHRIYAEGWTEEEGRDSSLEYRLTIDSAQEEDSGTYSCVTPARHAHRIDITVKGAECKPLPEHPDLEYSTNDTILGTRVTFTCKHKNSLVGVDEIFCSSTGTWSAPLPRCENIACPDISLLPAMAPLAYTSVTKNGTLKRNETAPPKINIFGTHVGGRVTFGCQQGYMIEGALEATCQPSGEWSTPIPLCKEVECPSPAEPENGYLQGIAPFKAGDLATFECNQGFMMEGQPIMACQDNGKWSKASGIKCTTGQVKNAESYSISALGGSISQIKFYYDVGDTVEFDCTEGYELQGSRMVHCLKTGKWSTAVPTCAPNNYDHLSNKYRGLLGSGSKASSHS